MLFGGRSRELRQALVDPEDLVPDRRLKETGEDKLEHDAIARSVAEIAMVAEAPTNIALFGPWGSGKSSVYSMIETHLKALRADAALVRYDAWKYGGQALKRNFIESISDDLGVNDAEEGSGLHQSTETVELRLGSWLKSNWWSLTLGVLVAIGVAMISLGLLSWASVALTHIPIVDAVKSSIGPAGTVLGLALAAMLVGPKVLEGAVRKRTVTPPSSDDQFSKRFGTTIDRILKKHKATRVIVFIDELDRCSPGDVVSTLVDLKTFLDQPHCVFIVAADREVIESSLHAVPQAKPVRDDEPYYATPGAFLDKIFQYQLSLPPLRPRALTKYARALVQEQGGVWKDMRAEGNLFEDVVFALVPVHVHSPRRVKVLINNFAANARIAQARGLPWLARAKEIAVLTVLETEFPNVAADMVKYPRLLESLRAGEIPPSPAATQIMSRYLEKESGGVTEAQEDQSPSGDLLADKDVGTQRAQKRLNEQLRLYVERIAAADVPDPRPDLFYLQQAGHTDGVLDPKLADAIDFVSDTAPDAVLKLFHGQPSGVLAVAVPLIVAEGEKEVGPGRRLAFETACRIVELMEPADIEGIAREVAPPILATALDGSWRLEATPGAVRLAFAARSGRSLAPMLKLAAANDPSGAILSRVADALPHALDDDSAQPVYTSLGESFATLTAPVLHALASLPVGVATKSWDVLSPYVVEVLEALDSEAPVAASTPASPASTGAIQVTTPSSVRSEASDLLEELIATVGGRVDGAELLATVYGTLQSIKAAGIQDSLREMAPALLQQVPDARAVNQIVLRGIQMSDTARWPEWVPLFRALTNREELRLLRDPSADQVLARSLLAAYATETCADTIGSFPQIVQSVAALCDSSETTQVDEAFRAMFATLVWKELTEASPGDATFDIFWLKQSAAHEASVPLRGLIGDEVIDAELAADLNHGIRAMKLQVETNQTRLLALVDALTPESAGQLVELLADFRPAAEEQQLEVVQLKLQALRRCDGRALPASELASLDDRRISRDIITTWLDLDPPVASAIELIDDMARNQQPLGQYASRLNLSERTSLWLAAETASVSDAALDAIGRHGVDAPAIDHMRSQLDELTRQQDRDRLVQRTMQCIVDKDIGTEAARKAVSKFAVELLRRPAAGDWTLAGKLVIWAGGAGRAYKQELQTAFKAADREKKQAFGKPMRQSLVALGFLPEARIGILQTAAKRIFDT
jgi:hypothetical protein